MSDPSDLPKFLREAFEQAESEAEDAPRLLGQLLEEQAPSDDLGQRLLARVEALPDRYLPFYDALMEMFDLDEPGLVKQLARAAQPRAFRPSGLPGVRLFQVEGGPRVAGHQTLLVRFGAGMRFPRHRHPFPERTLILEGGYRDERGQTYNPGDFDDRDTQGVHSFRALPDGPCVAASLHRGFEFDFFPLRWFAKLMGH